MSRKGLKQPTKLIPLLATGRTGMVTNFGVVGKGNHMKINFKMMLGRPVERRNLKMWKSGWMSSLRLFTRQEWAEPEKRLHKSDVRGKRRFILRWKGKKTRASHCCRGFPFSAFILSMR